MTEKDIESLVSELNDSLEDIARATQRARLALAAAAEIGTDPVQPELEIEEPDELRMPIAFLNQDIADFLDEQRG